MGVFSPKSFFFCLSLRTGGLAWAYLLLLYGIFMTLLPIYSIHVRSSFSPYSPRYIYMTTIVAAQLVVFLSISGLYGIYKKKASWMLVFVIWTFIMLGASILFYTAFATSFFIPLPGFLSIFDKSRFMHTTKSEILLLVSLPITVLQWHFAAVVHQLYQNVKAENNRKPATLYPVIDKV